MNDDDLTIIGRRFGYGGSLAAAFGIRRADRRGHLYALGKTGTGKSTLLERLIVQDIQRGEGVALLDPHGDQATRLLDFIPPERINRTCYFNPADLAHPVGFNILASHPPERRHLAVSGVVSAFKGIWRDSWGPRLEYILANAVAALVELPGATLLHLPRLLADDAYRDRVGRRLADPIVRRYWLEEFAGYDPRFRAEAIAPVQNKVGQLLMSPAVRHIFGQERSTLDPRAMMDRRWIFIANLSKGLLGDDKASLIGSLLVACFELAALSRADTPEAERPDFYLYVDEFQSYATESFASILSEARKYRLCLSLFHQFEGQIADPVRRAVFGNVGTILAFRLGQADAEHIAAELEHVFKAQELTDLGRFEIVVKLLEHNAAAVPFRAVTEPNDAPRFGRTATIVEQSRMRFSRPRAAVERSLARIMGREMSPAPPRSARRSAAARAAKARPSWSPKSARRRSRR
ncbi:conserved hypothetical protein [uncultured Defluviicoccus sp.]|uniref:Uncharacterized protein n=1 Tax=metagenome TaxID=256318 RepID=A0A380TJ92_9ZZZZ|nr:conserved hypothetical protein [uncultured Defluviicoccus sp.]